METLPLATRDAFRADHQLVQEAVRTGISHRRANAQDHHWTRWLDFCGERHLDPFLSHYTDPVPILQIFGQRYRDDRLAPSRRQVKSRTVEDAIRAVAQKYTGLGTPDPRKNPFGKLDFRLARQLRSYAKADAPPLRVKPVPITIVSHVLHRAHNHNPHSDAKAVADMLCIAFYFLLRPGEYTGTTTDDHPFLIQDVVLHLGNKPLDTYTADIRHLQAATSVTYTFTTQKNANRNEQIAHGRSCHPLCCPVNATIRCLLYHRQHNTQRNKPLASYYNERNQLIAITAQDITDQLRASATTLYPQTGIASKDLSARSLRVGGAMALLCGHIDFDVIKLLGRWHSDAMLRYLHVQAQPIIQQLAVKMYNHGRYTFTPTDTVPAAT